jgi:hypothetical protein
MVTKGHRLAGVPKLGRRPSDPDRLRRMIPLRLTGVMPLYPATADHMALIARWMLGSNDRFGTCGPTAVANFVVMVWKYCLGLDVTVSDAAVFDLYKRSGNPDFDPTAEPDADGNVPGDGGVDMTVMFDALLKGGIDITHADGTVENVKPLCYARVSVDAPTQRAVTSILGGVLWGADMQVAQQTQEVWDYVPGSPDWGGHAILGAKYTSDAAKGHVDESIASWAEVFGTTVSWETNRVSESYIPVFRPTWDHPDFQTGIDQTALAAAYEAATGRAFPVPVPEPPPGPQPQPKPTDGGWGCMVAGITVAAMAYHIAHPHASYGAAVKVAVNLAKIAAAALGAQ